MGRKKSYINAVTPVAIKRQKAVENQLVWTENYIRYGENDALPMKIAKLVDESPAAKACIRTISKYIKGAGFANKALQNIRVDKFGTTLWQLHSMLCDMIAIFDGFAVNFKYNPQGGITNAYVLSFESVRLKKPDDQGFINKVLYNPYFGTAEVRVEDTQEYPIFDIKQVLNQVEEEGTQFKGQVYFYGKTSPLYRFYPVPNYWSAKHWIEIDARIQEFHANNLENNFLLSVIWNIIGDPSQPSKNPKYQETYTDEAGVKRKRSTKTQGEEFNEMITEALAGAPKGGAGIGLWSGNHDTATKVSAFPTNSHHDLFNALQNLTTKNITIATQVPGILANISEGVNLGSGGSEMQKAVELMQSRVIEEQNLLTEFYNNILLPNLATPINEKVEIVNFNPITVPVEIDDKFWEVLTTEEKRLFIEKNMPYVTLLGSSPTQEPTENDPLEPTELPQSQVNDALKGLKISDINRLQKIAARFNMSKVDPNNPKSLTYEQAKQLLLGYGFSEEQVNAWLVTDDELEEDD